MTSIYWFRLRETKARN